MSWKKAPYPAGRSALLLSNPVSCSNFSFLFWHLASALFWSPSPRHLDKSSLSVPVSLSTLVSRPPPPPPPLSFSLSEWVCVFWSQRHCTLPTLCKNGPSVCACVFPAQRTGFLWLLYFTHTMMSDRVGKLSKLNMKFNQKKPSLNVSRNKH